MLITHENILRRFTENLVWATGIDLATAWATSNGGLRALQDQNDRCRLLARHGRVESRRSNP